MDDLSDEHLVERARADPGSAASAAMLDELFRRHRQKVAAWCYRLTGDVDAAADLAQDVLLQAFQRLDAFRGESRFSTWLYSITRNRCMDVLRSRPARSEPYSGEILEEMADSRAEDAAAAIERKESEAMVREVLQQTLDDTESKVMSLHYVDDLSLDAITRLLGLTNPSGAKAYIVNARRKLTRAFEKRRQAGGARRV